MYLNITASKDTYIQNKILSNRFRTSDANVGLAGTLDLFKLYGESALPVLEAVNQSEVVSIVFPDHDTDTENLDGLYFTIYDDADVEYYAWFDVNVGGNDPAVAGATGIQISVATGASKTTIATTANTALDALAPFSSTDKLTGEVELTVDTTGIVKNASTGTVADSDFTVTVTQQGNKAGTFNIDTDADLIPETAVELSRLFVDFDLSVLSDMGTLDATHTNFKATLYLYDILDGQMAPANFNVEVFPMAQPFTEGVGRDTGAFSDLDICNFVTASYSGTPVLWNTQGADAKGNVGVADLDIYCSSSGGTDQLYVTKNFVEGTEPFSFDVTDLVKEMLGDTPAITPNGFRISFSELEEQDGKTYFLKRFASRHALNQYLRPRLCISWDDSFRDNSKNAIFDSPTKLLFQNTTRGTLAFATAFEITQDELSDPLTIEELKLTISTGSKPYTNTISAPRLTAFGDDAVEQPGLYSATFTTDTLDGTRVVSEQDEIIRVELVDHNEDAENLLGLYFTIANNESAPAIYDFWFGDGIIAAPAGAVNNPTQITITAGDTASTITTAAAAAITAVTGMTAAVYSLCAVHVTLDTAGEPATLADAGNIIDEDFSVSRYQEGNSITLQDHIIASGSVTFDTVWAGNTAVNGSGDDVTLHTGTLKMETSTRSAFNATARNLSFSLLNVKQAYKTSERAKFRVFAKDHNENFGATKLPLQADSVIFDEIYYRVRDTVSGDLIIPFENDDNGTRMSTDSAGMYFEVMMSSLFPGRSYTVDLLIVADGNEIVYECKGTRFRVDL